MPRGLPDYYNPDTLVSQRLANVEEVVTAVKRIASLDNRGRTLFYDDFGEGFAGWNPAYGGDGAAPVITTAKALVSPVGVLCDAGTLSGEGRSYIFKRFHLGASPRLGVEAFFYYYGFASIFRMNLEYNIGNDQYFARLEVLPLTGDLRIWVPSEWITVGNVGYARTNNAPWLPLKLVADFASGTYTRLLVGQKQIDLSSYTLDSEAFSFPGFAEFELRCIAGDDNSNTGSIGLVAGTVDEP